MDVWRRIYPGDHTWIVAGINNLARLIMDRGTSGRRLLREAASLAQAFPTGIPRGGDIANSLLAASSRAMWGESAMLNFRGAGPVRAGWKDAPAVGRRLEAYPIFCRVPSARFYRSYQLGTTSHPSDSRSSSSSRRSAVDRHARPVGASW